MPELPEVETIRRDLSGAIAGKKIKEVIVTKDRMVRGSAVSFRRKLKGVSVKTIDRRGKLLIFSFKKQKFFMLIHLKMTGQLIYQDKKRVVGGRPSGRRSRASLATAGASLVAGGHSDPGVDLRD